MKKLLVALGFAVVATSASANISSGWLTVTGDAPVTIIPSFSEHCMNLSFAKMKHCSFYC